MAEDMTLDIADHALKTQKLSEMVGAADMLFKRNDVEAACFMVGEIVEQGAYATAAKLLRPHLNAPNSFAHRTLVGAAFNLASEASNGNKQVAMEMSEAVTKLTRAGSIEHREAEDLLIKLSSEPAPQKHQYA